MARNGTEKRAAYRPRTLEIESLETRELLAGNVQVNITSGNLRLAGDRHANYVAVLQYGPGRYAVAGVNGTMVNGKGTPLVISNFRGNIEADLGAGHDGLSIGNNMLGRQISSYALLGEFGSDAELIVDYLQSLLDAEGAPDRMTTPRDIVARTGSGRDGVGIFGNVRGRLEVGLGEGDHNALFITDSRVAGSLIARGGTQSDGVSVQDSQIAQSVDISLGYGGNFTGFLRSTVGGTIDIRVGAGGDVIQLNDTLARDDVAVRTGTGNDYVSISRGSEVRGDLHVDSGDHNDHVNIESKVRGNVEIATGNHHDVVRLVSNGVDYIGHGLRVDLGAGNDIFRMEHTLVASHVVVESGAGNDHLVVRGCRLDSYIQMRAGSGSDVIELLRNNIFRAHVHGGIGFDQLFEAEFNVIKNSLIDEFENGTNRNDDRMDDDRYRDQDE